MAANKVTVKTPGPAGVAGLNWEGSWATSTAYQYRDVVLFTNGGLYFCDVAHTSGSITPSNPVSGGITHWTVFIPAGDAMNWAITAKHTQITDSLGNQGYSSKHYSEKAQDWAVLTTDAVTNDANDADQGYSAKAWAIGGTEVTSTASRGAAKEWATKTTGAVDTADHSSKAWAIGGTGVSTTSSKGASKEWATKTNGAVDTADHSAKAWAIGGTGVTTTSSKGAAKEWATTTGGAVDTSEYSAKEYALGTTATSSKSYALKVDGAVTGTDFSSKAWAVGGTNVTTTASRGAAKEWATTTGGAVDTSEYSAKEWAIGTTVPSGSSKEWATNAGSAEVATGAGYSAKAYAQDDSNDIGSAKDWAVKAGSAQVASSDYSAKAWAQNTANNIGSAKDWATKTNAIVASSDGSAKAWAVGGTGVTDTASKGAAKEWATETSGTVDTSEYSAKEYAQGTQASTGGSSKSWAQDADQVNGAGTNDRSAKAWAQGASMTGSTLGGASKDWAQYTSGTVDGSTYSSKEFAQGTQGSTGGSAKNWAQQVGADVTGASSGDKSARSWAVETGGTAPADGSAKEWATVTGSAVASSEYSAKEYAQGTTATGGSAKEWAQDTSAAVDTTFSAKEYAQGSQSGTGGSAKNWATQFNADVTGASAGDMSAKEWAVGTLGRGQSGEGSSKDWATYTAGTVDNSGYSALYHANAASESAIAAKNSAAAVAQVYDNFADTYLGSMADGATASSGSANGTWAINSSSITVASTSGTIEVGQEVTGTGIPADANVISIDGSTVVISENMAAAGSGVSLTFTGHGVYGAFNGTKDGPGTDNDGDALTTGMLYFNTTDNEMRIYDGGNWIAASAAGSASFVEYKYVASGGQTTFTGSDANGATLSYTVSNVHVFLNGVRLDASDMTATNGTSIVLGSGAVANDELVIIAWKSFTVSDAVSASAGGTFNGNIIIAGDLRVNGGEFLDANGLELFKITSTGSAVNEFTLANAATGNAPTISVTGDDTNIDLTLSPKGSGEVNISKVDIDAGTIDGTTIATSNITVGSSKTLNVSAGTLTTSTAQKQAIVQAGPGSGTLDVSSGTFTTSAAQKQAIIDGGRTMPAGMIAPFGMSSAPTGWLVCNGSAVSRSTYSDLFGVISTTWGSGDGSSTFNLPDLRGAFLRGTGTAGVSSDYAGPNVGAYQDDANAEHNHTGSSANAGGHSHSGNTGSDGVHNHSGSTNTTGSHTHSYYTSSTWQTNGGRVWYSDSRGGASYTTGGSGNHSHSLSINNSSSHTHSISAESDHSHTITVANSGGTEARPYNRGVQYCIKT
jgi:microcystin-dependent protein